MAGGDQKVLPPLIPDDDFIDETPEELVGQLDDQNETDPNLQDIWDQIKERRSAEPKAKADPTEAAKQQQLHQKELERTQQIADKVKTGKQVAQKTVAKGSEQVAADSAKKQAVKAGERSARAAAKAAGEATKKAAKQAAKAIGQAIKKVVTQLLAKNPYVWLAVGIILLVLIIVLVIVALFSLGGGTGNGPAQYPSNVAQQEQATLLAALSGDKIANDKTVKEVIQDEKDRYQRMKSISSKYSANLTAGIEAKITEFEPLLDSLLRTSNRVERRKISDDLQKKMLEFEGTLPFGTWISQIAIGHQNQGSLNFCKITGAGANVACASFVSTVLWEAAVPNPIQAAVDSVWKQPTTRVVVDRPAVKSGGYYSQNKSKLRPGDLIFWGDGKCSPNGSVLFDHIGIYVGNDEAIDNSSSAEKILKRGAASRDSCRVFNAAKRYGADI